ncbi:MAG TPA: hypothetical protein GX720_03200 [Clostridiaceae bacterium]|nr:hypothetical protein [Clostridiaceae bacterium]
MNLLRLTGIKLKMIGRHPLLLAVCLLVPILLSLLAGATVDRNNVANLKAAYVDLAENRESRMLTAMLDQSGLSWERRTEGEIARDLELGQLDGVIVIPPGFGDPSAAILIDDVYVCDFIPGKNRTASDLIRENYLVAALALASEAKLQKDLFTMEGAAGMTREEMAEGLEERAKEAVEEGAVLKIVIREGDKGQALPLVQVPDVAVEVLFLSVFSLLSSLMLADAATQHRIRSLKGGFTRDFLSSQLALFLAGVIQLTLMAGIGKLLMPEVTRPANYVPVMGVLLLFMLAFGQWIALLPGQSRFVPASLLLFASLLAGGTFISLPVFWMNKIGRFTPHGWALASMTGLKTALSLPLAALAAILLLLLAFVFQGRSRHLAG